MRHALYEERVTWRVMPGQDWSVSSGQMSGRKSLTPNRASAEGGKTGRVNQAFQLVKCNVCQIEMSKKDLPRHGESVCKNLLECLLQLNAEECASDFVRSRTHLADYSFLCKGDTLFTPSLLYLSKG